MKALEILKQNLKQIKINREHLLYIVFDKSIIQQHNEAIEELEVFIVNYQEINKRLDNTITTMATIQNDNTSLVKILDKMGIEINDLKKENQNLKNRSCASCKYGNTYSDECIECSNSKTETEGLKFKKDFYCKYWESR